MLNLAITDFADLPFIKPFIFVGLNANSAIPSTSSAAVKVYRGGQLIETFYVPTGNTGTVWNVFYFDEDRNIHAVNSFDTISYPDEVYGSCGQNA